MPSARDIENAIRGDEFYGRLAIPLCFPLYCLKGEAGLRKQYMKEGSQDMDETTFQEMVSQCSQVMDVYQIILERSSSS